MSVMIILSRTSEPAEKRELLFDEETISLGRERSNILPLPGTQISKYHARIERQGSDYRIVDLNSTNSTYVNGEKLTPGKLCVLHDGDRVSISDYDLEFHLVAAPAPPSALPGQHTATDTWPPNGTLSTTTGQGLSTDVGNSELAERWAKLTTEIQHTLDKFDITDLARSHQELQARYNALAEENQRLKAERPDNMMTRGTLPEPVPNVRPDEARMEQVTRFLLQFLFKLSSGRSSFLSEFIVRTVIRTSSDLPMHPRSDNDTLRYFTDPNLSDQEFAERLALLKKEADQIVVHMIGLLEGYKRSVDDGTRRILQRVDPDRLQEDLPDTILFRYIPPLADLKLFRLIRNQLRDLLQEDRGVLEKQVFRPGFARAYEECVEQSSTKA